MKAVLLLALLTPLSVLAEFPVPAYPDLPAISVQNGWEYSIEFEEEERIEHWKYVDTRAHVIIFDWKEDGKVSRLKVTDPPQSFVNAIFVDSDADGYFDQVSPKADSEKKIKVPKIRFSDFSHAESARTIRKFIRGKTKFDYSERNLMSVTLKYFNDYPLKGEAWIYRYTKKLPSGRYDILHVFHFADGQIFEYQPRP